MPSSQKPRSQPPSLAPSSSLATSLPSSSHPTLGLATFNSTLTRCSQGNVRGIKEWNTGARMDIQFDSTFQPVGDQDASLNGQLGQIVRNGTKFPSHMTHFSTGIIGNSLTSPSPSRRHNLGIFKHMGEMRLRVQCTDMVWAGVGPSLASQALTMAEITQQVWEKLMQEHASKYVRISKGSSGQNSLHISSKWRINFKRRREFRCLLGSV
ncbi:unnamed protein product [Camellia sinensis]